MSEQDDILQLEIKIKKLKIEYDQYFSGMLKIPPFKLHNDVKQLIKYFSNRNINNTALAFKYKSLAGRYSTYNALWARYLRKLEEGTFKKGSSFSSPAPAAHKCKRGLTQALDQADLLYNEYISAKQSLNQNTNEIKIESVQEMVSKWTAQIKDKYKCNSVEFKVVIDDGRAKIKATPKK